MYIGTSLASWGQASIRPWDCFHPTALSKTPSIRSTNTTCMYESRIITVYLANQAFGIPGAWLAESSTMGRKTGTNNYVTPLPVNCEPQSFDRSHAGYSVYKTASFVSFNNLGTRAKHTAVHSRPFRQPR
jgi:hypothetical protein